MTQETEPTKSREMLVVIIMGSEKDEEKADEIGKLFEEFEVPYVKRVGSAHKTSLHTKAIIEEYNCLENTDVVFIAVAGQANALGPFTDAETRFPVITLSDKEDVMAGLRVPSGIGATVAIEPEVAAISALKILALNNKELSGKILSFQRRNRREIMEADKRMQSGN